MGRVTLDVPGGSNQPVPQGTVDLVQLSDIHATGQNVISLYVRAPFVHVENQGGAPIAIRLYGQGSNAPLVVIVPPGGERTATGHPEAPFVQVDITNLTDTPYPLSQFPSNTYALNTTGFVLVSTNSVPIQLSTTGAPGASGGGTVVGSVTVPSQPTPAPASAGIVESFTGALKWWPMLAGGPALGQPQQSIEGDSAGNIYLAAKQYTLLNWLNNQLGAAVGAVGSVIFGDGQANQVASVDPTGKYTGSGVSVAGDVQAGTLHVGGAAYVQSITINGTLYAPFSTNNPTFTGTTTVATLTASGPVTAQNTLSVTGLLSAAAATLTGTLTGVGAALSGNLQAAQGIFSDIMQARQVRVQDALPLLELADTTVNQAAPNKYLASRGGALYVQNSANAAPLLIATEPATPAIDKSGLVGSLFMANLTVSSSLTSGPPTFTGVKPYVWIRDTTAGQATPDKVLWARNGQFQICNNAFNILVTVDDTGNLTTVGGITATSGSFSAAIRATQGIFSDIVQATQMRLQSAGAALALNDTTANQTTPNKLLRSLGGLLHIRNSGDNADIWSVDDAGNVIVAGATHQTGRQLRIDAPIPYIDLNDTTVNAPTPLKTIYSDGGRLKINNSTGTLIYQLGDAGDVTHSGSLTTQGRIFVLSGGIPYIDLFDTTPNQATPHKTIASWLGQLRVSNSAGNAVILQLDDAGNLSIPGTLSASGYPPPQPAPYVPPQREQGSAGVTLTGPDQAYFVAFPTAFPVGYVPVVQVTLGEWNNPTQAPRYLSYWTASVDNTRFQLFIDTNAPSGSTLDVHWTAQ